MKFLHIIFLTTLFSFNTHAQDTFNYSLTMEPISISGLPGLHSYAVAQHDNKWLIIGGRKDGMHARTPFTSFPEAENNTDIYVIDITENQFWSASMISLPTGIFEQLQSTNMNFKQDGDTLYIIGGYGYSLSAADHITYDKLTSIQVSSLIDAIMNGETIEPYFKQISDDIFAIAGGQMGKIDDTFYIVGGQRFDGSYNPVGNPTYTQTYTNQIRKFTIDNRGEQLSYANYTTITDPVHLRRRDYNLLPQIFPDGTEGFTISSGVFQENADLPFLYPVDITPEGHAPITAFNQYLSHYHSAKTFLYDSNTNSMHSLLFGGMSQYYYQDGNLIKDDNVPFVNTISRLTRSSDGTLNEYQLPLDMPGLQGSSAEFILNTQLPHYHSEIIKLSEIQSDTILIGHIYGGIESPSLNPFTNNITETTVANNTIYSVHLHKEDFNSSYEIKGLNPYSFKISPNPFESEFRIYIPIEKTAEIYYYLTSANGQIIQRGAIEKDYTGPVHYVINVEPNIPSQALLLTIVIDNKYYLTKTILKK